MSLWPLALLIFGLVVQQDSRLAAIQQDIAVADGLGQFYDRSYRPIEATFWQKIPEWLRADAANGPNGKSGPNGKARRILDVGCGYGTLLSLATTIYKVDGYCLDVTDYLKPTVAAKYGLHFARRNIELDSIPWSEPFDVIIMTEVIEHLNFHPVPTLTKIRKALAPGGRLFLSTPDQRDWGPQHRYYKRLSDIPMPSTKTKIVDDHIWIYSQKDLESVVRAAGLTIERMDYSPGQGARHFNVILRRAP